MARMLESVLEGPDHLMTKKNIRRKMDPKDDSRLSWRPAPMIACGPVLTHALGSWPYICVRITSLHARRIGKRRPADLSLTETWCQFDVDDGAEVSLGSFMAGGVPVHHP